MKKWVVSADWVLPISSGPIQDGAVLLEGEIIQEVGPRQVLQSKYAEIPHRHFSSAVLLPGFVNAHTHTVYTALRGKIAANYFASWLKQMVQVARENQIGLREMAASCRQGIEEGLRSGVTTFADIGPSETALEAMVEKGVRGIFYLEVFSFAEKNEKNLARRTLSRIEKIQKSLPPRLKMGVSPHSPYTASPKFLRELSAACAAKKIPFTLHLAESPDEKTFFQKGDGPLAQIFPGRENLIPRAASSVKYLEDLGVLSPPLLAAHCVDVDTDDRQLLAQRGVRIASCPTSNARLQVGAAPLPEFLQAGIPVGLGTDSAASSDTQSFFATLRDAVRLTGCTPEQALEIATLGGARALGLDSQIGSLAPGKLADLIVIHLPDLDDPINSLITHGSPERIELVMIGGSVI